MSMIEPLGVCQYFYPHSCFSQPEIEIMFSGIKFIPRDQVNMVKEKSDSDSLEKERKKLRSCREKDRRRKNQKAHHNSSDDEENEKIKKASKRRKKWYSSDASFSSSLSQNAEDSDSDSDDGGHCKGKISMRDKKKRKEERTPHEISYNDLRGRSRKQSKSKRHYSSDPSLESDSESDDGRHLTTKKDHQEKQRKHKREKKKEKHIGKDNNKNLLDDGGDYTTQDAEGLSRKEIGLEWMLRPMPKPCAELPQNDDPPSEPQVDEVKKPNRKELNPYLKDNASGLPDDDSQTQAGTNPLPPIVGDGGASWRLKALKRAQEQAAREGRQLDEVLKERWGSLSNLAVSVASSTAAPAHAHLHAIKDRKRGMIGNPESTADNQSEKVTKTAAKGHEYLKDVSIRHPEMREPKVRGSLSWGKRKDRNFSAEDTRLISSVASHLNKYANDGNFLDEFSKQQNKDAGGSVSFSHENAEGKEDLKSGLASSKADNLMNEGSVKQVMSANQLAAKVLQLRMKGKHEEAEKLLKEADTKPMEQDPRAESSSQGMKGNISRHIGRNASSQRRKENEDSDMHLARTIVQNKQFSISGQADDEYDFDGAPSRKRNRKREGKYENKLTEKNTIVKRLLTEQERCQFCFENPSRPKHLVIAIANFTYLMLPQWQPVVQGHCCILPMQHESATRTVDNNVWEEIRNFKKCLLMMFAKQDKEVVFLETVMGLAKQRRHCLIECIPLPCNIAKEAPLYFKKAIDEAEEEWSQHNAKRLIDTSEKGLRASIPKDFPYFHVEFGLNKGFVHVIDDERQFKSNLGLNVIRGMLHLPEEDMYRRRKQESIDAQKQAVASFAREWDPFDWTKQLD